MRAALLLALLAACQPTQPGPVMPDATYDGGCAVDDKATAQRLVRGPDGMPVAYPCDAGH